MNKKAITILGAIFLLIVGTIGFLLYQRSKNNNTENPPPVVDNTPPPAEEPPPSTDTLPPTDILPPAEEPTPPSSQQQTAIQLTDGADVVSPILFYQGNGVSYFNSQGQLFQADLDTSNGVTLSNTRELTVPLKAGIKRVIWPQAGNNYIVEYEVGTRPVWSVYVADRGEYVDLPSRVTSIDWMPGGDKIVYMWVEKDGKATINVANPDNTGWAVLTDIWEPDNVIKLSPDGKTILFHRTQTESPDNKIVTVTADGKVFKTIVKDGYNTGMLWSPDSKKFLFLKREGEGDRYMLWVANLFSGEIKNLEVVTAMDKVTWTADSQSIVAAETSQNQGGDTIVKINLASGEKQEFSPGLGSLDVREPFLTATQDYVLFRNAVDKQLYAMPLFGN